MLKALAKQAIAFDEMSMTAACLQRSEDTLRCRAQVSVRLNLHRPAHYNELELPLLQCVAWLLTVLSFWFNIMLGARRLPSPFVSCVGSAAPSDACC